MGPNISMGTEMTIEAQYLALIRGFLGLLECSI